MTSIWPVEKEWSKIAHAAFQVNKIVAWRKEVKAFFSLCLVLQGFICFHPSIDFMWGQPGCAWCSMFLCKLQTLHPAWGTAEATLPLCRAHREHPELTSAAQWQRGTKRWPSCCTIGSRSGFRSPRPLQSFHRDQKDTLGVSILLLSLSLGFAPPTQASG